jgi:O-antigen/teichoic acid export membrane protein
MKGIFIYMRNQLKAGAVLSYVALFVNSAISIAYTPIMLRLLGQSEYGLYSLASSAIAYVGILNFGLGNALIRYTAKYRALDKKESCAQLNGMFFIMYFILGVFALVVGSILTLNSDVVFSNSLSVEEMHQLKILMAIMVINISMGIGLGIFSVILLAYEKFIIQKVISIISSVISPLIMLPLLILGYDSVAMAIVSTIVNFITIIINIYYCFKVLKIKFIFSRINMSLLKEIIIFSTFIFLNLIIEKIYWSTDQIILGIYSGPIAVSIYTIGASFSGYFSGFSAAISSVFLSKVSGMVAKEISDVEISNLFIRIGRLQYLIISFALCGFIVFGQEFINLWVGKDYYDSFVIALFILVPMMIPLIQGMGGVILQARNMQKFKTILYLIIAILNLLLSIILVRWWGAIGCAIATGISFTIGNVIIMNFYYWKKIGIDIPKFWNNILGMSFPFFVSLIAGLILNYFVTAESWLVLIIKIVGFSFLNIFLIWFTAMNKYEKDLISVPSIRVLSIIRRRFSYSS